MGVLCEATLAASALNPALVKHGRLTTSRNHSLAVAAHVSRQPEKHGRKPHVSRGLHQKRSLGASRQDQNNVTREFRRSNQLQKCPPGRAAAGDSSSSDAVPSASTAVPRRVSAPSSVDESVTQATSAVSSAIADGRRLQQLELLLPLIAPSLLDDWPGGIEQQLQSATPLVTKLLKGLSGDTESSIQKTVLSDEDAVVLMECSKANLVVFPTADVLPRLRELAKGSLPLLIVNPQWQPGQVISDFGFGSAKREAEEFLKSFTVSYSLKSTRVKGSQLTQVRSYPSDWCVYVADEDQGGLRFAGSQPERPTYRELEGYVRSAENSSLSGGLSFFEKLAKEFQFIKDSK